MKTNYSNIQIHETNQTAGLRVKSRVKARALDHNETEVCDRCAAAEHPVVGSGSVSYTGSCMVRITSVCGISADNGRHHLRPDPACRSSVPNCAPTSGHTKHHRRVTMFTNLTFRLVIMGIALATGVPAKDKEDCPERKDPSLYDTIKLVGCKADNVISPFTKIIDAYDTTRMVADWLGLWDQRGDEDRYEDLKRQIYTVAVGINWEDSDYFISTNVGKTRAALGRIKATCDHKGPNCVPFATKDEDTPTGEAAQAFLLNTAVFRRPFGTERDEDLMEKLNLDKKKDLYAEPGDLIYDWRYGVPAFMTVISHRLIVVAFLDPNFRKSPTYQMEFDGYRAKLIDLYNKMLKGIRYTSWDAGFCDFLGNCGFKRYEFVDIFSGLSVKHKATDPISRPGPDNYAAALRDLQATMPLFEVKSMIDALYVLIHPGTSDLTEHASQM